MPTRPVEISASSPEAVGALNVRQCLGITTARPVHKQRGQQVPFLYRSVGMENSEWLGRYDDKKNFIERLQPLIDRQIEIYNDDPPDYVRSLTGHMQVYFVEWHPSRKISLACLLAECLITTHCQPTAEYIWRLMHDVEAGPDGCLWDPCRDPGLTDLKNDLVARIQILIDMRLRAYRKEPARIYAFAPIALAYVFLRLAARHCSRGAANRRPHCRTSQAVRRVYLEANA